MRPWRLTCSASAIRVRRSETLKVGEVGGADGDRERSITFGLTGRPGAAGHSERSHGPDDQVRIAGFARTITMPKHRNTAPSTFEDWHWQGRGRRCSVLFPRCLSDNLRHSRAYRSAMAKFGADRIFGTQLRHAICLCLLNAEAPLTVPEVITGVEVLGCPVPGRPSKTVSDALRWEVRRGRAVRVDRSLYRTGAMPRSAEWWIRRQVASQKLSLRGRQRYRCLCQG